MKLGSAPFLASHLEGDTAWLNVLYVAPELRHHGLGRRMFEDWLHGLPKHVKTVRLIVADIDGESSVPFWEKMGFHFDPRDPELGDMTGVYMVRPVHEEIEAA